MNYVNYFKHILYTPDTLNRRIDFDVPENQNDSPAESCTKRTLKAALPFFCLYRPIGTSMSFCMGTARLFSCLKEALSSENSAGGDLNSWKHTTDVVKTAIAASSLATTLFSFGLGLYLTTFADLVQGLLVCLEHAKQGKNEKLKEELLQTLSSSCYLAFMMTGALELMLVFAVVQALTCFVQARKEFGDRRYIEGLAKVAMGMIRGYQARGYHTQILRRDAMLAFQKYQELARRALKGREVRHLLDNPLNDLDETVEKNRVVLSDGENEFDFGSHVHGFGKGLIKGDNLIFRTQVIDGKEVLEFEFKVNHVHREQITESFKALTALSGKESAEILAFMGSHAKGIEIGYQPIDGAEEASLLNAFLGDGFIKNTEIKITGLGSILFLESASLPNLHDKIVIRMDKDKTIYDLHELISFMDLEEALCPSTLEDIERIKIGQLFRTFFPAQATPFERTEEFFSLSIEKLKAKIIEKSPEMEKIFDVYLSRMQRYEIFQGRIRYTVPGLGQLAHALGARAITSAITGAYEDDDELYRRVLSILRMGMLSPEARAQGNVGAPGLGGGDWLTGGADSVYTQMLTEQHCKEGFPFNELYMSKVRLLISLDALDTVTYQHFTDAFGNRIHGPHWIKNWIEGDYNTRPDILTLTQELQNTPMDELGHWAYDRHEIMFKERLDPSFIKGLIVADFETKNSLLAYFRSQDFIKQDETGQETILGIALDRFIRVGTNASEELLTL